MKQLTKNFGIAMILALYGVLAFDLGNRMGTDVTRTALAQPFRETPPAPPPPPAAPFTEVTAGNTTVRIPSGPGSPFVHMTSTETAPTHNATVESSAGSFTTDSEKVALDTKNELPPMGLPSMFGSVQTWLTESTRSVMGIEGSGPGQDWVLYLLGGVVLVAGIAAFVWGAPSIGVAGVAAGVLVIASVKFPILLIGAALAAIAGGVWYAFNTRGLRPSLKAITQEIEVLDKKGPQVPVPQPDGSTKLMSLGRAVKAHIDAALDTPTLSMIDKNIDPLKNS